MTALDFTQLTRRIGFNMSLPLPKRGLPILASALLVSACAGTPHLGGDPRVTAIDARDLPAPMRGDLASVETPYLVGPFDRLTVNVFGIQELSNLEVQVDASGRMAFPLAGVLEVAGKTPEEIAALLVDRLKLAEVLHPHVTVNLKETLSHFVTIEGTVGKPGLYPVLGHMTLLRAIATAQGTTEFSRIDDVVVQRTVNGKFYVTLYNLKAIRNGAYADPVVYANDVVVVGDNHARRLFKDYLTVFGTLAGPLTIVLDRTL